MAEGLKFVISGDDTQYRQTLERVKQASARVAQDVEQDGAKMDGAFKKAAMGATALLSIQQAREFAGEVIRVRSQIESMSTAFEVFLGSQERSAEAMRILKDIAASSPLTLDGLGSSLQTMLGFNVEADKAIALLKQMGDISGGDVQKLQSLALSFSQASSTGRLMGQDLLQMINAGFNPLVEISRTTGRSIAELKEDMSKGLVSIEMLEGAFASVTAEGGKFHGMLEKQGETLKGVRAQFAGAIDDMYNRIGESNQDLISDGYKLATSMVHNYEAIGQALMAVIALVGVHKAAVIAHNVVEAGGARLQAVAMARAEANVLASVTTEKIRGTLATQGLTAGTYQYNIALKQELQAELESTRSKLANVGAGQSLLLNKQAQALQARAITLQTALDTASTNANTASKSLNAKATAVLTASMAKLKAVMVANVWTIAAVGIAAIAYGLYKLATQASAAEVAQKKLNDELGKYKQYQSETAQAIDQHISTIQSETETNYNKIKSYEALKKLIPEITNAYSQQEIATLDLAKAEQMRNDARDRGEVDKYEKEVARVKAEIKREREFLQLAAQSGSYYYTGKLEELGEELKGWESQLSNARELKRKAEEVGKDPVTIRIEAQAEYDRLDEAFRDAQAKLEEATKRFSANPWLVPVKLKMDVDLAGEALSKQKGILDGLIPSEEKVKETVAGRMAALKQVIKSKEIELKALRSAGALADKKSIEDAEKAIKDSKAELELYRPKSKGDEKPKTKVEREREQIELREARERHARTQKRERIDLARELEELEVSLMQEGAAKTIAQLDLKHQAELEALKRQKEDYLQAKRDKEGQLFAKDPKNKNKAFDPNSVSLSQDEEGVFARQGQYLASRQAQELAKIHEAEAEAMNKYLSEYGLYEEKRLAIARLYAQKIAQAKTEGEKLSLSKEQEAKTAQLDAEANKTTDAIAKLFGDMRKRTATDMRAMAEEAQQALNYIVKGVYQTDAKGKPLFGITPERLKVLKDSPTDLKNIRDQIQAIIDKANQSDTALGKMSAGLSGLLKAKKGTEEARTSLDLLSRGFGELQGQVGFATQALSVLGDLTGSDIFRDIASGLGEVMNVADSALKGFQSGGIVGGIVSGVTALVGTVSKSIDKMHDKRIKTLQDNIDILKRRYEDLDRAIDKAFSSDASNLIGQQNELLKQQQELLHKQAIEESNKKGGGNQDVINDKIRQIEELDRRIEDNKQKAVDAIFGQDIKSAISDFANAYAEAWAGGGDRDEAIKEQVRSMMKKMIVEQIKALSSPDVQRIRQKLEEFWSDKVFDKSEQEIIERMASELQRKLDGYASQGVNGDILSGDSGKGVEASKRGFEGMSQDTANELNGRFTAMQQTLSGIGIIMEDLRRLGVLNNGYLEDISKSNRELYRMNERLANIERNTKNLR